MRTATKPQERFLESSTASRRYLMPKSTTVRLDFYRFVLEPESKKEITIGEAAKDNFVRIKFHREYFTTESVSDLNDLAHQCDTYLTLHYGAVIIKQGDDITSRDNLKEFFQDMVSKYHIIPEDNFDF
jgi:hypothetical protein